MSDQPFTGSRGIAEGALAEHTAAPGDYTPRCPDCGATEGLLRISEERAEFEQPVKALYWNGPHRVRVAADGEKHYTQEGVKTVAVRCSSCGYTSEPVMFAAEIVARAEGHRG